MACRVGFSTTSRGDGALVIVPSDAVRFVVPTARAVTVPHESTRATLSFDDSQVTRYVTSIWVPSDSCAVAPICPCRPTTSCETPALMVTAVMSSATHAGTQMRRGQSSQAGQLGTQLH